MKVVVISLDPNVPWSREARTVSRKKLALLQGEDHQDLRSWWGRFCDAVSGALRERGHSVERRVMNRWDITPDAIDALGVDVVFVPHAHPDQIPGVKSTVFYYGQTMARWLFVADSAGPGPAAAGYNRDVWRTADPDSGVFERYRARLADDNASKFAQVSRRPRLSLLLRRQIPLGAYVFFPCQIPHDEAVRYFSPAPESEILAAVVAWARRTGTTLVLKEHPANRGSMAPLREIAAGRGTFWSEASIHDLIDHCDAVFTINSGVGFEALTHGKPVVTFGEAEYDCVTIRASISDIAGAWSRVRAWRPETGVDDYRRYFDWFTRQHAIDLSNESALPDRLHRLCERVESEIASSQRLAAPVGGGARH